MATLATNVSFQCFDLDGKPLAGGKVYTYSAGTTTSKATYTTMAGTVANPNPVILDQNGKAKIFLGDGAYRMRILDSNDALIDDINQISRYVTHSEFATFQQTVNDGVSQLTEVREQIDVFVNTSIGNQKGFANGITPLDVNVKVDPIYLPTLIDTPLVPRATETALGVAKIATTAIAQEGVDDTDFLTAKKLADTVLAFAKQRRDLTGQRLSNTTYVNTNPYPIFVTISAYNTSIGNTLQIGSDYTMLGGNAGGSGGSWTISTIVMPSEQYMYNGNIYSWIEVG